MSIFTQHFGSVGFQPPVRSEGEGSPVGDKVIRELYRTGKLTLSALTLAVCKPSDHAHAVRAGKVTAEQLVAAGVDLRKCDIAYARATGDGSRAKAQRQAMVAAPSTVELALIRSATDVAERTALTKVAEARKAKRKAAKVAKAGKVLSSAEIAALAASLGVGVSAKVG